MARNVKELVAQMTLEEKAALLVGKDFWNVQGVERLGIPSVMCTDGPHGLRKQAGASDHIGLGESVPATCYPAGSTMACSWDPELMRELGETYGLEAMSENVAYVLGPAVNIKRSPLCGRNFEYFSEDPYLAGKLAVGYINGVQSRNVGTSIKHFAANNQEYRRMSSDSQVDERTLREIYLPAFEIAVKEAQPWTVMCSYNQINGTFASENPWLLTDVLQKEWGHTGYVVSDWGAVNDRVKGVAAGLALEMPGSGPVNVNRIVEAVKNGSLDETQVDNLVGRILDVTFRYVDNRIDATFDKAAHHAFARRAAAGAMVLLKNDGALPLAKSGKIAVIGEFAMAPRYQGGGSSHINPTFVDKMYEEMVKSAPNAEIVYEQGFVKDGDAIHPEMVEAAAKAAKTADVAVLYIGLPDHYESEGYDRSHMNLPGNQLNVLEAVLAVQPNVVVVLAKGSPVELPFADRVRAILDGCICGQAGGGAIADLLFGDANPSGKLAETVPMQLEDNPSFINFPGEKDVVQYREGIFVGYRHYEKVKRAVRYPFGHGLSYTTFAYTGLSVDKSEITDRETVSVSVTVKNTGSIAGREIVQLYVQDVESLAIRPVKELKGFAKVSLEPGEEKTVSFTLCKRAFAYWNTRIHDWHVETGAFRILAGGSSADTPLCAEVTVTSTVNAKPKLTIRSTIGDLMEIPEAASMAMQLLGQLLGGVDVGNENEFLGMDMKKLAESVPLSMLVSFSNGQFTEEMVDAMLKPINDGMQGA